MFKKIIVSLLSVFLIASTFILTSCGQSDSNAKTSSYEIVAELKDDTITGTEKCTFFNNSDNAFTEVKFNLFANAFRSDAKIKPVAEQYKTQSYYKGESFGDMQIGKVTNNNLDLDYEICGEDQNILKVNLDKEIFPNEYYCIDIEYTIKLAKVISRTGINQNTINLANFYPILCGIENDSFYECLYYANGDPYYSDCANYKVTFKYDEKYIVANSGKVIESKCEDNMRTDTYLLNSARSFAIVLCENFEILTDNSLGVTINYYYYKDSTPEKSLNTAVLAIKYFSEIFGNYIYSDFSVVETEFIQGGMEFPGLVMISDMLEERAYQEVIIHETSHQWWMAAVGNNEIENAYMDESLAEYSVVLFYENHQDFGYTRQNLMESSKKTFKIFCSVYDRLFGNVDTSMNRATNRFTSEYEYVNIAYVKGCIMFDELRNFLKDGRFFSCLQKYFNEYKFKNAKPEDMIGVFESSVKESASFMESYINGTVIIG